MKRIAFKMKLLPGFEQEYRTRHDALWPELVALLKETGITSYSIFLDEATLDLFGFLTVQNEQSLALLPAHPVMKKWWAYMKDIMETNADDSPKQSALTEVFYLQ